MSFSAEDPTLDMPAEKRLGFRIPHKIALCFALLVALVLTAFWLTVKTQLALTLQQQADALGGALARQTADAVTELVLANDLLSLNVVLNQLVSQGQVANVAVFNVDNQVIASAGSPARGSSLINAAYAAQIALQDSVAGTLRLTLDPAPLRAGLARSELYFRGVLALGVLFAIAAGFALGNHLAAPLRALRELLADPRPEELDADYRRGDEIGQLQRACAVLLAERLEAEEEAMIPAGLGKASALGPGAGARLQGTVLVVKVVNVHTAVELLHPATLARLLAEYSQYLQQAGKLYGGMAHRLDGEFAVLGFDARFSADHAFNALCCASLFLMLMQRLNTRHRAEGSPALEFRLGIHGGDIFLAALGGRDKPGESLMGRALDTAMLVAGQARPGRILVSEKSWREAGGEERLGSAERVEISLGGDAPALAAFNPAERSNAYAELLERQARHLLPADEDEAEALAPPATLQTESQA